MLGLESKGKLTEGADADITVIDYEKQKAVHAFSMGHATLLNGKAVGTGGTLLTTEQGRKAAQKPASPYGLPTCRHYSPTGLTAFRRTDGRIKTILRRIS